MTSLALPTLLTLLLVIVQGATLKDQKKEIDSATGKELARILDDIIAYEDNNKDNKRGEVDQWLKGRFGRSEADQWLKGRFGRDANAAEQWLKGRFGRESEQWLKGRFGRDSQWLKGRFGRSENKDQWLKGRFGREMEDESDQWLKGRFGRALSEQWLKGRFGRDYAKNNMAHGMIMDDDTADYSRDTKGQMMDQWLKGRFGREMDQWLKGRFGRELEQWLKGRFGRDAKENKGVESSTAVKDHKNEKNFRKSAKKQM